MFAAARHREADKFSSLTIKRVSTSGTPVALVYVIYINPLGDLAYPLTPYPYQVAFFFA